MEGLNDIQTLGQYKINESYVDIFAQGDAP